MIPWWLSSEQRAARFARHLVSKAPPRDKISEPKPASLAKVLGGVDKEMRAAAEKLASGSYSLDEWIQAMQSAIYSGHFKAYQAGTAHGGLEATDEEAQDIAQALSDLESYWLQGFANDIAESDPRYVSGDGAIDADGVVTRSRMYQGRMRGTANGGFVDGSDDEATFDWVLGGVEEHCDDCPIFAEASPYAKENVPATPGSNDTPCLWNCKCHLVRDDGKAGYGP